MNGSILLKEDNIFLWSFMLKLRFWIPRVPISHLPPCISFHYNTMLNSVLGDLEPILMLLMKNMIQDCAGRNIEKVIYSVKTLNIM